MMRRPAQCDVSTSSPAGRTPLSWRCLSGREMQMLMNHLRKLMKDERGGEVLEYALILGLIVVAAAAVITTVGGKVLANWKSVKKAIK